MRSARLPRPLTPTFPSTKGSLCFYCRNELLARNSTGEFKLTIRIPSSAHKNALQTPRHELAVLQLFLPFFSSPLELHSARLQCPLKLTFISTKSTNIFTAEITFWLLIVLAALAHLQALFTSTPGCPVTHASFGKQAQDYPLTFYNKPSSSPCLMNNTASSAPLLDPSCQLGPCMALHIASHPALVMSLFQLSRVVTVASLAHIIHCHSSFCPLNTSSPRPLHCLLFLDVTFPEAKILFHRGNFPGGNDTVLKIHSLATTGTG